MGHPTLPAADQAPGNPELPLAKLDAQGHELADQILLRPTPEHALSPQLIIFQILPLRTREPVGRS